MKILISMILFLVSLSADGFLEPDKAFSITFNEKTDKTVINIELDKTVYLYEDKTKIFIGETDITKEVLDEKPIEYDGFIVFKKSFSVGVSKEILERYADNGKYKLIFKYQGCSVDGLCYAPLSKEYLGSIKSEKVSSFSSMATSNNDGFLLPDKAFMIDFIDKGDNILVSVKLDETVYLYDDKIKVLAGNKDITKDIFTLKPIEYDGFIVHKKSFEFNVPKSKITSGELTFKYQGCSVDGLCYAPMSKKFMVEDTSSKNVQKTQAKAEQNSVKEETQDETSSIASLLNDENIFIILATFFGFGLLLSFTPCIFPMVPILSSIIVQHSKSNDGQMSAKKGLFLSVVYVLSMAMAYTIAGVLAGLFGANIQAMLQNPFVLVIFSGVFVALAFSLFGYYSLELPTSFQNKINQLSGNGEKKGGVVGVAIMGFLSALIVGPCVAPPLAGALVYIGQTGDAVLGGLALFFMSIGLGAPLLLVGIGAGKYMPKPGGWMETVSKVFGIVMLGLAVYMLDRVLDPLIIMFIWAALLVGTGLYLQVFQNIIARTIAALVLIYGVIVFVGAVSGGTNIIKPLEKFTSSVGLASSQVNKLEFKKVKSLVELEIAIKESTKPVILDFWAEWCISCKELDNFTFTDPAVIAELSKYTLLKADVTDNTDDDKEMMKKFNVFGPPALIFWDKNGNIQNSKRIVGYKNPKDFLEIVTK